jgi:branched-chain amino acid transport system ATP-binding protein
MLTVRDLTVRYGRITALRQISFTVDTGELVSIVGPNGAGKTSTLAAIVGTVPTASGEIRLDDTVITGWAPEAIVRRGVALVPEGRRIFGSLTVAENLAMGASVRRPGRDVQDDVEHALQRFPALRRYFRSAAGRLSGGEQQMLAIARGLMSRPRVLLLDEPSLGLAPLLVEEVFESIVALRRDGVTVLLIEQNAHRAVELSDRTYVLRTGHIVASGTANELAGAVDLAALYLGVQEAR